MKLWHCSGIALALLWHCLWDVTRQFSVIEPAAARFALDGKRLEQRHPKKNTPLAVKFDDVTEVRGSVKITADHENAKLVLRFANTSCFDILNTHWPAEQVQTDNLDELAKMIVTQPSWFA